MYIQVQRGEKCSKELQYKNYLYMGPWNYKREKDGYIYCNAWVFGMFEKLRFLAHLSQLRRDKYARWHAANEKSCKKNTSLFLSLLFVSGLKSGVRENVMDSHCNPSCHAVFPLFYRLSNSVLSVSLSEDGWQTSWNDPRTFTSTQLIVSSRLTNG